MPLIETKHFEQEFTDNERSEIIRAVTDAMVSFTGKPPDQKPGSSLPRYETAARASAARHPDSQTCAPSKTPTPTRRRRCQGRLNLDPLASAEN